MDGFLNDNPQLGALLAHMVKMNDLLAKYRTGLRELTAKAVGNCPLTNLLEQKYQQLVEEGRKVVFVELLEEFKKPLVKQLVKGSGGEHRSGCQKLIIQLKNSQGPSSFTQMKVNPVLNMQNQACDLKKLDDNLQALSKSLIEEDRCEQMEFDFDDDDDEERRLVIDLDAQPGDDN